MICVTLLEKKFAVVCLVLYLFTVMGQNLLKNTRKCSNVSFCEVTALKYALIWLPSRFVPVAGGSPPLVSVPPHQAPGGVSSADLAAALGLRVAPQERRLLDTSVCAHV